MQAILKISGGILAGLCIAICGMQLSAAAELPELRVVIDQHHFTPSVLDVPVGQKFRLIVENRDATAEEFESHDLNREKIVAGKSSIVVFIGPLRAGTYEYFGDFNSQTARGRLIAK